MGILIHNFFQWTHKAGMRLVSPWNRKARMWLQGQKNILDTIRKALAGNSAGIIWMHCHSLGEFEQGLPVMEKITSHYPEYKLLVTFSLPTGYELRKNHLAADYIFYLPEDSKNKVREFLNIVKPKLVLSLKNGYWFYYLDELKRRRVPVLLLSGVFTKGDRLFHWYGGLQRKMLECFTHIFVQTEHSKRLLGTIGYSENVTVAGDTRFDRVIEIAAGMDQIAVIMEFCGNDAPVIVAGSTWEEDDEELDHYANSHPEIKFIIAPYEIDDERLREVKKLFRRATFLSELEIKEPGSQTRLSKIEQPFNVLIIDKMGILPQLYSYATIAYVGGGFVDEGVHNVLEAAVFGKPVVFGPVIEQFVEALELADCGGGLVVDSALEVEETFNRLLTQPDEYFARSEAAKNYVYSKRGATATIMRYIQENRLLTN